MAAIALAGGRANRSNLWTLAPVSQYRGVPMCRCTIGSRFHTTVNLRKTVNLFQTVIQRWIGHTGGLVRPNPPGGSESRRDRAVRQIALQSNVRCGVRRLLNARPWGRIFVGASPGYVRTEAPA